MLRSLVVNFGEVQEAQGFTGDYLMSSADSTVLEVLGTRAGRVVNSITGIKTILHDDKVIKEYCVSQGLKDDTIFEDFNINAEDIEGYSDNILLNEVLKIAEDVYIVESYKSVEGLQRSALARDYVEALPYGIVFSAHDLDRYLKKSCRNDLLKTLQEESKIRRDGNFFVRV